MIKHDDFSTDTGSGIETPTGVSPSDDELPLREWPAKSTLEGGESSFPVEEASKSIKPCQLYVAVEVISGSGQPDKTVSVGADSNTEGASSTTLKSAGACCRLSTGQSALHATDDMRHETLSSLQTVALASGARETMTRSSRFRNPRLGHFVHRSQLPLGVDVEKDNESEIISGTTGVASKVAAAAASTDIDDLTLRTARMADNEDSTAFCGRRPPQRHPFVVPLPGQELVSKDLVEKIVRQNARLKQTLRQLIETHYGISVSEYLDRLEQEDVKQLRKMSSKNKPSANSGTELSSTSRSRSTDSTVDVVDHVTGNVKENPRS